jgi:hypothetical protein
MTGWCWLFMIAILLVAFGITINDQGGPTAF